MALSFTEDFESFAGGLNPTTKPDQDWYDYEEAQAVGEVSAQEPSLSGTAWMRFQADAGDPSGRRGDFVLAAPTKLTNITFQIHAATPNDNGNGSRQFIAIQSSPPTRDLVTFYVFCTDPLAPDACEFRVRFETVDSTGQVLINTSLGQSTFNVTILPDWTSAQYQLIVNGVDDGVFPFLELPANVGRIRIGQQNQFYALEVSFDEWFIDGAAEPPEQPVKDIAGGLQDFAIDIHFTTATSLFLLGLVFFVAILAAVAYPLIVLGEDRSALPAISFFGTLAVLWFVFLEWWPDWIGILLIILVSALISLVVRRLLMGMRDASNNAGIVAGSLGYFIIATALLAFSGYATEEIEIPSSSLDTPEDANETVEKQSYAGAITECAVTIVTSVFGGDMDCSRKTTSKTWAKITDIASSIFNFARTAFEFLFQLLTFQLPIPTIFNAMIVLPPAAALATVGFSFITRSGS